MHSKILISIFMRVNQSDSSESGSGKTTLAMSIMHLLSYEGEIRICDKITQEKLFGIGNLEGTFK